MTDLLLKPKEVANQLHVSVKTLQRWDKDKKLIAHRDSNNRRVYTQEQIDLYLKSLLKSSEAESEEESNETENKSNDEKENKAESIILADETIIEECMTEIHRVSQIYTSEKEVDKLCFSSKKTKDTLENDKPLCFGKAYPHYLEPIKYEPINLLRNRLALTDDILSLVQSCFTKEYYLQMQTEFKKRNLEQSVLLLARMDKDVVAYKDFAINLLKEYNRGVTFGYLVCSVDNVNMSSTHMKEVICGVPFLDITVVEEIYGFSFTLEEARQLQLKATLEHNKRHPSSFRDEDSTMELDTGFMELEVLPIPLNKVIPRKALFEGR